MIYIQQKYVLVYKHLCVSQTNTKLPFSITLHGLTRCARFLKTLGFAHTREMAEASAVWCVIVLQRSWRENRVFICFVCLAGAPASLQHAHFSHWEREHGDRGERASREEEANTQRTISNTSCLLSFHSICCCAPHSSSPETLPLVQNHARTTEQEKHANDQNSPLIYCPHNSIVYPTDDF